MAITQSYTNPSGRENLNQDSVARPLIILALGPKPDWDPESKKEVQKTSSNNVLQWTADTLFQPLPNDVSHKPEVVPVTITSAQMPNVILGQPVKFVNFHSYTYVRKDDKTGRILGVGRSFGADGVIQEGVEA